MKNIIITLLTLLLLAACGAPTATEHSDRQPDIYPDYRGVTIPASIAPLDFTLRIADGSDLTGDIYVKVEGSKGGQLTARGDYADFDIDDWQALTRQNQGGELKVTVTAETTKGWTEFKPFTIYVSPYPLKAWGLTYRLIDPGYEVGGDIGIYQRDLSSFVEEPILTEKSVPGRCMNCHTPNRTDPRQLTLQIRGENGGTLISKDGGIEWVDTKTEQTQAAGSYAYWHPDGRYVAYATNSVHQSFFTGKDANLEVYHLFSNIVVLDTKTNELILAPQLNSDDYQEIFPAFSADGKKLYYSTSKQCNMPAEYLKVKCSIVSIPFDDKTGTFGTATDTLLNGRRDNRSYLLARPSYDGRWLMYTVCSRSNFSIAQRDADLWLMDLRTRQTRPLTELNTPETESYHNWSADSHWVVFSSKREDGVHTRLYLASVDDKGRVSKPFLLPQRDPWRYYHALFKAYNTPDFTRSRVTLNPRKLARSAMDDNRKKVTIRK